MSILSLPQSIYFRLDPPTAQILHGLLANEQGHLILQTSTLVGNAYADHFASAH
jgi:hypothetical protein